MKRLLTFLFLSLTVLAANANHMIMTFNGIKYDLDDATMTATISDGGCSGNVIIDYNFNLMQQKYVVTDIAPDGFKGNTQITSMTLPYSIKTIGANAFSGCSNMEQINIPAKLETVGEDAFDGCTALGPIQFSPEGLNHWLTISFASAKSNPLYYGNKLMSEGNEVSELAIPESVIGINPFAFAGAKNITKVNFKAAANSKAAVNTMAKAAAKFSIGEGAFLNCEKLQIDKLPLGMSVIMPSTFEGCSSITEFTIYEGIKSVGPRAFAGCTALKDFYCRTSYVPTAKDDTFAESNIANATLHVYKDQIDAFMNAIGWKDFGAIEAILSQAEIDELLATDFFAMTAHGGDVEISMKNTGKPDKFSIQTSFDKIHWSQPITYDSEKYLPEIIIPANQTLYIRRYGESATSISTLWGLYWRFTMNGSEDASVTLSGNIMSLLDKTCKQDEVGDYAFYGLFENCKMLTEAEDLKLPAMKLGGSCYEWMFFGCENLLSAPTKLPAEEINVGSYSSMFRNCLNLKKAPDLSSMKTLSSVSCSEMFLSCNRLTEAPVLPNVKLAFNCYYRMFAICISLTSVQETLPTTEIGEDAAGCYEQMYWNCTNLVNAPKLPATELKGQFCYSGMFRDCKALTTAPELPATVLSSSCYSSMFVNCTSLTEAPELPATEVDDSNYTEMFSGCTALKIVPTLPAKYIGTDAYAYICQGCSKLRSFAINAEDYFDSDPKKLATSDGLKDTYKSFTLYCPQALIDLKGIDQIKTDFGLRPDANVVAIEVLESAILDEENHTARLGRGTRGGRHGGSDDDSDPDSHGRKGHRLTFPAKITIDGQDYDVIGFTPDAFADLDGITEIVIESSCVADLDPSALDGKDLSGITLYVPEELVDEYAKTEPWSRFWPNIKPIREHVTTPQGEFIIDHLTESSHMVSGGKTGDWPTSIVIPAYIEVDGTKYPVVSVGADVFADLTGIESVVVLTPYVPDLDPHALDGKDLSGITLYVPAELIDEYRKTEPWNQFPVIKPLETSAIHTPSAAESNVSVALSGNTITMTGIADATHAELYTVSGSKLSAATVNNGKAVLKAATPGVHIIKAGNTTRKVMVK